MKYSKSKKKVLDYGFGAWETKGSGVGFVRKIRDEAEERVRSMESVKVPKSMFGKSKNLKLWAKKDRMKLRTDE